MLLRTFNEALMSISNKYNYKTFTKSHSSSKHYRFTLIHLLFLCYIASKPICAWRVNQHVMLPSNLKPQAAILALSNELMQDLTLVNRVILMLKHYIYLKKKETTCLTFFGLKAYIKNMETTEHKIASQREKLDFHNNKWDNLSDTL